MEPPASQPASQPTSQPVPPSFDSAWDFFLSGEYTRAIEILDELAKAPKQGVKAACARSAIDL
ncbi:MAG: hypothetical protein ACE5EC_02050, partial [Phycisphaerae bacterium]